MNCQKCGKPSRNLVVYSNLQAAICGYAVVCTKCDDEYKKLAGIKP